MQSRRVAVGVVLGLAVSIVAINLAVPSHWFAPCDDGTLARTTPVATFSFTYNVSEGTMTITHAGGEHLQSGGQGSSEPLPAVVIEVSHGNGEEQYLWVARNGSGIATGDITPGDSIDLANPGSATQADVTLHKAISTGDTVRVIWINHGSTDLLNRRCRHTLDQITLSSPE